MTDTQTGGAFRVFRDGRPMHVRLDSHDAAFAFLLERQGQSVHHATTYEGYEIREVPAGKWSADEAADYRRTALRMFRDHGHAGYWDEMTRDSCGTCALNGWGDDREPGTVEPNYAGWERLYVQAGRTIPARYTEAFRQAVDGTDNPRYDAALALDIATFGAVQS